MIRMMASEQEAKEIKRKHSAWVLQQPGVCGFGVEKDASGGFILTVHLDANCSDAGDSIPASIEGCPVRRIASGPFTKQ
jgi:hypothetical protein